MNIRDNMSKMTEETDAQLKSVQSNVSALNSQVINLRSEITRAKEEEVRILAKQRILKDASQEILMREEQIEKIRSIMESSSIRHSEFLVVECDYFIEKLGFYDEWLDNFLNETVLNRYIEDVELKGVCERISFFLEALQQQVLLLAEVEQSAEEDEVDGQKVSNQTQCVLIHMFACAGYISDFLPEISTVSK